MKLDIEALAREAGFHVYNGCVDGITADARRLARLIVERCAAECKQFDDPYEAACAADTCAAAIRQLLEDK